MPTEGQEEKATHGKPEYSTSRSEGLSQASAGGSGPRRKTSQAGLREPRPLASPDIRVDRSPY